MCTFLLACCLHQDRVNVATCERSSLLQQHDQYWRYHREPSLQYLRAATAQWPTSASMHLWRRWRRDRHVVFSGCPLLLSSQSCCPLLLSSQSCCPLRSYCGSTVWPVSQCNPQTIPCCYSITRTTRGFRLLAR